MMAQETRADPVRVHIVLPRALPRLENLGTDDVPRNHALPRGQEAPPGRFDINGPGHDPRVGQPRLAKRPIVRHLPGTSQRSLPAGDDDRIDAHWAGPVTD